MAVLSNDDSFLGASFAHLTEKRQSRRQARTGPPLRVVRQLTVQQMGQPGSESPIWVVADRYDQLTLQIRATCAARDTRVEESKDLLVRQSNEGPQLAFGQGGRLDLRDSRSWGGDKKLDSGTNGCLQRPYPVERPTRSDLRRFPRGRPPRSQQFSRRL